MVRLYLVQLRIIILKPIEESGYGTVLNLFWVSEVHLISSTTARHPGYPSPPYCAPRI